MQLPENGIAWPARRIALERFALAASAALAGLAAAFAPSPPPALAQAGERTLAYRTPTAVSVTYHATDTLAQTFSGPGGSATYTLATAVALATTFAEQPEGVRVTATPGDLSATLDTPTGTETQTPGATGAYVFDIAPDGSVEVLAAPEIAGPAEVAAPLVGLPHEWFPRLPARAVEAGETWADTVTWSDERPESSMSSTTAFRYELVGDTVVDGRALWKISLAGEAQLSSERDPNGERLETTLAGANAGVALWDHERGLLHSLEVTFDYSGTMNTPLGDLPISVKGSSRRWLDN